MSLSTLEAQFKVCSTSIAFYQTKLQNSSIIFRPQKLLHKPPYDLLQVHPLSDDIKLWYAIVELESTWE